MRRMTDNDGPRPTLPRSPQNQTVLRSAQPVIDPARLRLSVAPMMDWTDIFIDQLVG